MGRGSWSGVCPGRSRLAEAQSGVVSGTEYIQPVCLPAAGQALVDGKICTVTGWGNTQYYGESCPLLGSCLRETLSWAGEGQLGYASASWTRGCRDTEQPRWALGGEGRGGGVHAPQLRPALPAHPQANRLGCSRRPESP